MKSGLFFVLFVSLVAVAFSSLAFAPKPKGKPGDCWTDLTGPLQFGEVRSQFKNDCLSVTCPDSDNVAQIATCGAIGSPTGVTSPDYTKPYPECCPRPKGDFQVL